MIWRPHLLHDAVRDCLTNIGSQTPLKPLYQETQQWYVMSTKHDLSFALGMDDRALHNELSGKSSCHFSLSFT